MAAVGVPAFSVPHHLAGDRLTMPPCPTINSQDGHHSLISRINPTIHRGRHLVSDKLNEN